MRISRALLSSCAQEPTAYPAEIICSVEPLRKSFCMAPKCPRPPIRFVRAKIGPYLRPPDHPIIVVLLAAARGSGPDGCTGSGRRKYHDGRRCHSRRIQNRRCCGRDRGWRRLRPSVFTPICPGGSPGRGLGHRPQGGRGHRPGNPCGGRQGVLHRGRSPRQRSN
jgi:hypothetical protein